MVQLVNEQDEPICKKHEEILQRSTADEALQSSVDPSKESGNGAPRIEFAQIRVSPLQKREDEKAPVVAEVHEPLAAPTIAKKDTLSVASAKHGSEKQDALTVMSSQFGSNKFSNGSGYHNYKGSSGSKSGSNK